MEEISKLEKESIEAEIKDKWTLTVEEDPETGELVLPFSNEILETLKWKIGDTLTWTDLKNGSWSLTKKEASDAEIHTDI